MPSLFRTAALVAVTSASAVYADDVEEPAITPIEEVEEKPVDLTAPSPNEGRYIHACYLNDGIEEVMDEGGRIFIYPHLTHDEKNFYHPNGNLFCKRTDNADALPIAKLQDSWICLEFADSVKVQLRAPGASGFQEGVTDIQVVPSNQSYADGRTGTCFFEVEGVLYTAPSFEGA